VLPRENYILAKLNIGPRHQLQAKPTFYQKKSPTKNSNLKTKFQLRNHFLPRENYILAKLNIWPPETSTSGQPFIRRSPPPRTAT
jgi:hypothetical protein